jgi:hypothetical protein
MTKEHASLALPDQIITSKIYLIRNKKVMLDRDLAGLYGIKAIRLREQVKRNKDRFPEKFMFQLSEAEVDILVSQNAIPSKKYLGGSLPIAFTEHGILMLANVIKNERAIKVSIRIIEVFVRMQEMLQNHNDILLKLEEIERKYSDHNQKIMLILNTLRSLKMPNYKKQFRKTDREYGLRQQKNSAQIFTLLLTLHSSHLSHV